MTSNDHKVQRRVRGYHDIRMDGMTDLVTRARGKSVLDLGCNRGMVGFEMYCNGARLVHGCDNYEVGIQTAREVFADLRSVQSQFEVVDLTAGVDALRPFGAGQYDIILMIATLHKIKRVMPEDRLSELLKYLGRRTQMYFGWRGTSEKHDDNEAEMKLLDRDLGSEGLRRIHTSYISDELGVCAVWEKKR